MDCTFLKTQEIESQIKCPYCAKEWTESWEEFSEDGEKTIECDCGKNFSAEQCTTVDYRTSKNCELNGDTHNFENSPTNPDWAVCSKCGANTNRFRKEK